MQKITREQLIEKAAELFASTLIQGRRIYLFGTGHSHMLSEELCQTNKLRQSEENKIVESVLEKIEEEWENHINDGAVIVLADDNKGQFYITSTLFSPEINSYTT